MAWAWAWASVLLSGAVWAAAEAQLASLDSQEYSPGSSADVTDRTGASAGSTFDLGESLRRQLMNRNYDYMEREEPAPPGDEEEPPAARGVGRDDGRRFVPHTVDLTLRDQFPSLDPAAPTQSTPKNQYTVLKVARGRHARRPRTRRTGGGETRHRPKPRAPQARFVKERGAEGVAIISLDGALPPEFRLPAARRQYMQDSAEGSEDYSEK